MYCNSVLVNRNITNLFTASEVVSGSGSILGPDGTETVTVQQGESLQVPCHSGAVSIPSRVEWYQNGTLLTSNDRIEV